jgi:hypothetical protein
MLLSYLATTMTLPRSPILIPQLSYKIKNFMFYDKQGNESGERECLTPHTCRLTSQNRLCNDTYGLLIVTDWLSNWFLKWVTLFISKVSFHSNPSCLGGCPGALDHVSVCPDLPFSFQFQCKSRIKLPATALPELHRYEVSGLSLFRPSC